jgi:hypothetical protein
MKTISLLSIIVLFGCMASLEYPEPQIKSQVVTYEGLQLLKPAKVYHRLFTSNLEASLPAQTLKKYADFNDWILYKAKVSVPEFPLGCGLAINKIDNTYGFWVNRQSIFGLLPDFKHRDLQNLELKKVAITEQL